MPNIYCASDIHGELDRFERLLETIRLSGEDRLYIIGDVIDRKPSGVEILRRVIANDNITMLMGNHERMCLDTLFDRNVFGARKLWQSNGGSPTYRELVYRTDSHERMAILRFLSELPVSLDIRVEGKAFHLVHGRPAGTVDDMLWGRVERDMPRPFPNKTVIVGHTPTPYLTRHFEKPFEIWYGDGVIDIDCGCGNETGMRRLACLRLNDMHEFYI